jgi:hypothetical protein
VLAVLVPPLGVLTEKERLDKDFWINVLLTLIAWLVSPGSTEHSALGLGCVGPAMSCGEHAMTSA